MLVIPELNMRLVWVVPERMRLVTIVPELILDQCILLQDYWANAYCSKTNTHKINVGTVCFLPELIQNPYALFFCCELIICISSRTKNPRFTILHTNSKVCFVTAVRAPRNLHCTVSRPVLLNLCETAAR